MTPTTQIVLTPSDDYLERVESAANVADGTASDDAAPMVVIATFAISVVLVAAAAALGSAPLFVGAAATTVIAAAEVFSRAGVPEPAVS